MVVSKQELAIQTHAAGMTDQSKSKKYGKVYE